jgi:hypothetical protein
LYPINIDQRIIAMANIIHDDDDGFDGPLTGGRLLKGPLIRWNETTNWIDRDGLKPPEPLLALSCAEALQQWKEKRPIETITAKPLPDITELNSAVPIQEWELGPDGRPKAPWVHQYAVYLIDPGTATFFSYTTIPQGLALLGRTSVNVS